MSIARKWVAWCLAVGLSLLATVAWAQTSQPTVVGELLPGAPVERDIRPSSAQSYSVTLRGGQYVAIALTCSGTSVTANFVAPSDTPLPEVTASPDTPLPTMVCTATGANASYTLVVRADGAGTYTVRIAELRDATAAEQSVATAERLVAEGDKLWSTDARAASEKWTEAIPFWQNAGRPDGVARMYANVSVYYDSLRLEKEKALIFGRKALETIAPTDNPRIEARSCEVIAGAYYSLGDNASALRYYERALERYGSARYPRGSARMLNSIGHVYDTLREYKKALDYYQRALEILKELKPPNPGLEGNVANNMAHAYAEMGDQAKALELYSKSVEIHERLGLTEYQCQTVANIGLVYATQGDQRKALDFYAQSLVLARKVGAVDIEASTLYRTACAERNLGDIDAALQHIQAAIAIFEVERSNLTSYEFRNYLLAKKQDLYTLAVDLLMRLDEAKPGHGFAVEALAAAERGRARGLLDMLAEAGVDLRKGVDPALLAREEELSKRLNRAAARRQQLRDGSSPREEQDAAAREVDAASEALAEATTQLYRTSPGYAAIVRPQPLSVDEIRRQVLDPDTALLYYALGDKRSYLWVVTDRSFNSYALPSRETIEAEARRFHELASAPGVFRNETPEEQAKRLRESKLELQKSARALGEVLLGAVGERPVAKRLAIVADGTLNYVPFAAITEPASWHKQATERPLVADYEIVNLPSASALAALRAETAGRRPAPQQLAVFADPVFQLDDTRIPRTARKKADGPTLPAVAQSRGEETMQRALTDVRAKNSRFERLVATRDEARAIIGLVPKSAGRSALDFDANREAAVDPDLARYRIVHFATHALLDARHPELSGIVLSLVDRQGNRRDGFLRLHDVYDMRLGADLVVLSACGTALGEDVRGEGLVGLTRGFMYAGVPCVLGSLWNVSDKATGELMKRFYANMLGTAKMPPAAALRAAQLSMAGESQWDEPFNWAGFAVQGDWR